MRVANIKNLLQIVMVVNTFLVAAGCEETSSSNGGSHILEPKEVEVGDLINSEDAFLHKG
jgi:hypothetical protein